MWKISVDILIPVNNKLLPNWVVQVNDGKSTESNRMEWNALNGICVKCL